MKSLLSLLTALLLSTGLAQAVDTVKADTAAPAKKELSASQQRMVDCNKDAAGKKVPNVAISCVSACKLTNPPRAHRKTG